ncbi:MAG TPA: hypothetical protein VFY65_15680 [Longimicrobium sp.]|nr:hypothetical protein [Longimicrobium sp.]
MADSLAALGLELQAEAAAWLAALTPGALPDGTLAARELFQAFGELEAEVAGAAANEVELTRLRAWLTTGFFAPEGPYAPADTVVAEAMDEARHAAPAAEVRSDPHGPASRRGSDSVGPLDVRTVDTPPRFPAPSWRDPVDDGRGGGPAAAPDRGLARRDHPAPRTRADRSADAGPGARPSPGAIEGLGALAAFAGSGGIDLHEPREDADHPSHAADPSRGAEARTTREPELGPYVRPAQPVDADRADAAPAVRGSAEEVRRSAAADPSADAPAQAGRAREAEAAAVREVDRREVDAVRLPPRIVRIPFQPQAVDRMEDADGGWTSGAPLPIPFLTPPGEDQEDAGHAGSASAPPTPDARQGGSAAPAPTPDARQGGSASTPPTPDARRGGSAAPAPAPDGRQPLAIPSMRVFGGAAADEMPAAHPTPDARPMEAEWAGFGEPGESSRAFLAHAARVAGRRPRRAAETERAAAAASRMPPAGRASPAPAPDSIPSAYASGPPAAAEDPVPTVLVREVAPQRPVQGVDWPMTDVTDLLDALASEIAHEYRRYYGE